MAGGVFHQKFKLELAKRPVRHTSTGGKLRNKKARRGRRQRCHIKKADLPDSERPLQAGDDRRGQDCSVPAELFELAVAVAAAVATAVVAAAAAALVVRYDRQKKRLRRVALTDIGPRQEVHHFEALERGRVSGEGCARGVDLGVGEAGSGALGADQRNPQASQVRRPAGRESWLPAAAAAAAAVAAISIAVDARSREGERLCEHRELVEAHLQVEARETRRARERGGDFLSRHRRPAGGKSVQPEFQLHRGRDHPGKAREDITCNQGLRVLAAGAHAQGQGGPGGADEGRVPDIGDREPREDLGDHVQGQRRQRRREPSSSRGPIGVVTPRVEE